MAEQLGEVLMDLGDDDRILAYRGGDAFDGSSANVTGCKDAA